MHQAVAAILNLAEESAQVLSRTQKEMKDGGLGLGRSKLGTTLTLMLARYTTRKGRDTGVGVGLVVLDFNERVVRHLRALGFDLKPDSLFMKAANALEDPALRDTLQAIISKLREQVETSKNHKLTIEEASAHRKSPEAMLFALEGMAFHEVVKMRGLGKLLSPLTEEYDKEYEVPNFERTPAKRTRLYVLHKEMSLPDGAS